MPHSDYYNVMREIFHRFGVSDALIASGVLLASVVLVRTVLSRQSSPAIALNGPPRTSLFSKIRADSEASEGLAALYDSWVEEYGPVFKAPSLGGNHIVLCDPKAIAHFHARDTFTYVTQPFAKNIMTKYFGPNMLQADGKEHQRLRRAMAPAFTNATIRRVTSVFYDAAHKVKDNWNALFESSSKVTIDVQKWMNKITLDSIGIAGFGYGFKSLEGHRHRIIDALDDFGQVPEPSFVLVYLLGSVLPQVADIPVKRIRVFKKVQEIVKDLAAELQDDFQKGMQDLGVVKDQSILGLLFKGSQGTGSSMREEEIVATVSRVQKAYSKSDGSNLFLLAGLSKVMKRQQVSARCIDLCYSRYNGVSPVSLTWILVELSRKPDIQQKLRKELREFSGSDPTWDQLTSGLPFLDAVVHETLRLHPPLEETVRVANEDDIIPLSTPMKIATGEIVDSVFIPKGTAVTSPFVFINRSEQFWGPDAKEFKPERWLMENPCLSKDLHGHRHIYTFSDGPKICLGKGFAITELKAVLSVLIRNFVFELPNGPSTKVVTHPSILKRPKLAGEVGPVLRLRVEQVSDY
ncbi:hypothetical protein AX15_002060 [Amanita polypyramis BW_CC]|nr:hypothetical protein AX15_002060 [Amanita polypyramis BW_CC]